MKILGFNVPTTAAQQAKTLLWLVIGGATGALLTWHGGAIDWHAVLVSAVVPALSFLHESAQKAVGQ